MRRSQLGLEVGTAPDEVPLLAELKQDRPADQPPKAKMRSVKVADLEVGDVEPRERAERTLPPPLPSAEHRVQNLGALPAGAHSKVPEVVRPWLPRSAANVAEQRTMAVVPNLP